MTGFTVSLTSTADICAFVTAATGIHAEIDVVSGRYTVDAKSIMGLFSLNLKKPMEVRIYGPDEEAARFQSAVSKYIISTENAE